MSLLPGGASSTSSWRSAKLRLPRVGRLFSSVLARPRLLLAIAVLALTGLLWSVLNGTASELERFYCWGPAKAPMDLSPVEAANWHAHLQTPVIYNHHRPVTLRSNTIDIINLNNVTSTKNARRNNERVLILTPLKDAAPYLEKYFDLLSQLSYPHHLIDLGFLVGDSTDDTLAILSKELDRVQSSPRTAFAGTTIVRKDMGSKLLQDVESRHGFAAQGPRRKLLGKIRNYLLSATLKPDHAWVYWRDVDIVENPPSVIEDFVAHDRDVLVPNIWFHRFERKDGKMVDIEGRFDYNSWQESPEGLALAASLDKDTVLAEGYKEYKTNRRYMAKEGDRHDDKDEEMPLDGVGGVNIIVKADVHRSGINFPAYAFENQAETEGFAKMARRAGYGVYGLPNYVVWHIDTDEKPGNA